MRVHSGQLARSIRSVSDPRPVAQGAPMSVLSRAQRQCLEALVVCGDSALWRAPTRESLARRNLIERTSLGWRITDHGRKTLREHKVKHA